MITILPSLKTVVMILMMNVKVVDNKDDADTNLHGKVDLDGKLNPDDNTNVDVDNQIFDPDNTDPEDSQLISSTTIKVLVMIIQMIEDTLGVVDWSKKQL